MEEKNLRVPSEAADTHLQTNRWTSEYRQRHQLRRVDVTSLGIVGPKRVRIYSRRDHYVLQWWDSIAKCNLNQRVNGDLVAAIACAREIDSRLEHFRTSGQGQRKLKSDELIDQYLSHLRQRGDAGELAVVTIVRYASALEHFRSFARQSAAQRLSPYSAGVTREYQLAFAAYLMQLEVAPNGHDHAKRRPLQNKRFVLDTVRAMYQWAADPGRGNLLPSGFQNPFLRGTNSPESARPDLFGEPDITTDMAVAFLNRCDAFQLSLFAPLVLFGLRASEPVFLFREHLDQGWLKVICMPDLNYLTKGKRDKRFPVIAPIDGLLLPDSTGRREGLLYTRRGLCDADRQAPLFGTPLAGLVAEFRRRCAAERRLSAQRRKQLRDELFQAAGGLSYDHVEAEFGKVARPLKWPKQATLKDFRHLFSTCLENAAMPEYYRRYFMGQSPGKAAIATYTHLNELKQRFDEAAASKFHPITQAIQYRAEQLNIIRPQ